MKHSLFRNQHRNAINQRSFGLFFICLFVKTQKLNRIVVCLIKALDHSVVSTPSRQFYRSCSFVRLAPIFNRLQMAIFVAKKISHFCRTLLWFSANTSHRIVSPICFSPNSWFGGDRSSRREHYYNIAT